VTHQQTISVLDIVVNTAVHRSCDLRPTRPNLLERREQSGIVFGRERSFAVEVLHTVLVVRPHMIAFSSRKVNRQSFPVPCSMLLDQVAQQVVLLRCPSPLGDHLECSRGGALLMARPRAPIFLTRVSGIKYESQLHARVPAVFELRSGPAQVRHCLDHVTCLHCKVARNLMCHLTSELSLYGTFAWSATSYTFTTTSPAPLRNWQQLKQNHHTTQSPKLHVTKLFPPPSNAELGCTMC